MLCLSGRSPEFRGRCLADYAVACTLFPLVAGLLQEVNPLCLLLDPAEGVDAVLPQSQLPGPNRLDVTLTGSVVSPDTDVTSLFKGWTVTARCGADL